MSNQEIKLGDIVYMPTVSNDCLEVRCNYANKDALFVRVGKFNNEYYFDKHGVSYGCIRPSVYLANLENKTKLEAFYNIQLEDIPSKPVLES